jgi:hypothetical protein
MGDNSNFDDGDGTGYIALPPCGQHKYPMAALSDDREWKISKAGPVGVCFGA